MVKRNDGRFLHFVRLSRTCPQERDLPAIADTWLFRSRVIPFAPIRMPLLGQLMRSACRVVSVVIVSPQLTLLAASAPLDATTPAKTRITIGARPTSVAGSAAGRILAGILPPYLARARSWATSRSTY